MSERLAQLPALLLAVATAAARAETADEQAAAAVALTTYIHNQSTGLYAAQHGAGVILHESGIVLAAYVWFWLD